MCTYSFSINSLNCFRPIALACNTVHSDLQFRCVCAGWLSHSPADCTTPVLPSIPSPSARLSCAADYLDTDVVQALKALPGRLEAAHHIKGVGGEVMRPAVLRYIHKLCLCHVSLLDEQEDSAVLGEQDGVDCFQGASAALDALSIHACPSVVLPE